MSRTRARSSRKASMTWPATTRYTLRTTLAVALIGMLAACSGTSAPSATTEDRQLPTAWPYANHDLSNTRATTASTINSSDVSQLGIAWTRPIAGVGAYGGAASTPLVSNGTVYFQDLASNVTALSVDDGSAVWTTRFDNSVIGPNGPALDGNSVIAASSKAAITALDASTGDKRWTTTLVKSPTAGVDIQPVAYDGLVYTSTVPGNQSSFSSASATPAQAQGGGGATSNRNALVVKTPDGTVFTPNTLDAKAGSKITVTYDNESTLPHDLHFYAGSDATAPSLASTKVATGPDVQNVSFTTPSTPGTYFFQCDVHPEIMTGTLVVR